MAPEVKRGRTPGHALAPCATPWHRSRFTMSATTPTVTRETTRPRQAPSPGAPAGATNRTNPLLEHALDDSGQIFIAPPPNRPLVPAAPRGDNGTRARARCAMTQPL